MNKLGSGIIFALAILGGLFVVLTIYYAISDNTDVVPTIRDDVEVRQQIAPPTRNVSDYIGYGSEQAFMGGCTEIADQSYCQCMFDYIDQNMTNEEFENFADMADPSQHPMFDKAINNCI